VPVVPPVPLPLLPAPLGEVVLPAPLGEVVLLPLLGDVVLLPLLGDVVLPLPDVPPPVEPLVMPSSFRHFSRSAPTMPRHLLLVPPAALPVLLPEVLGVDELLAPPDALGVELLLPEALGVELLLLPEALGVELVPELCASDTLDSAKSAAAVAAVMSLRVIWMLAPYCFFSGFSGFSGMPLPLGLVVLPLPDAPLVLGEVPPAAAPSFLK
jgi:hypothetical protein